MACLMKRTPCCLASSPSSCGSMMTKRDLSKAKCRSISGSVPLPIEPKPIMTIGPEIFAWICGEGGFMKFVSGIGMRWGRGGSGGAAFGGHFDFDLHLGFVEAGDDKQSGGPPDVAEGFTPDPEQGIGIPGVGGVVGATPGIG